MAHYNVSGMDELSKQLKEMQQSADDVMDTYNNQLISFDQLFSETFMREHTEFLDFNSWISQKFEVNSQEDFDSIDVSELDQYVVSSTDFENWQDMLDSAGAEFLQAKLNF